MFEMEKEGEKHALGVGTRGSFNSNHVCCVLNTTSHFNDEYIFEYIRISKPTNPPAVVLDPTLQTCRVNAA